MNESGDLLDSIDLGSARGGRRIAAPLQIEVGRSLTPEDLPALQNPAPVKSPLSTPTELRYTHHQLAKLIARGIDQTSASLITGYSPSYISILCKHTPAFIQLVADYKSERDSIFVDTLDRMKALGINALEELQDRLAKEPEKWSRREIMELADLLLVKPMTAGRLNGGVVGGSSGGASVSVNVKFVSTGNPSAEQNLASGPIIDLAHEEFE